MYIPWTGMSAKTATSSQSQPKRQKIRHIHSPQCAKNPTTSNCFEIRDRTSSFDLHQIGDGPKQKASFISRLFRSRSADSMKAKTSPKASPKQSPKAPRRRFVRVVRDDHKSGEEYVNPHVIRKYNPGYWDRQQDQSKSLDEATDTTAIVCPLPYSVSGPTILKKQSSVEDHGGSSSSEPRHAKFKEEVEVLEFHIKDKCLHIQDASICRERLHDDTISSECILAELALESPDDVDEDALSDTDSESSFSEGSLPALEEVEDEDEDDIDEVFDLELDHTSPERDIVRSLLLEKSEPVHCDENGTKPLAASLTEEDSTAPKKSKLDEKEAAADTTT